VCEAVLDRHGPISKRGRSNDRENRRGGCLPVTGGFRALARSLCPLGFAFFLVLTVAGCGGVQPVEWSELGAEGRARPPRRSDNRQVQAEREPTDPHPSARVAESRAKKPSRADRYGLRVQARSNREVARLGPEDLVRIMRRVGFSDEQILDLGVDLHTALRTSGGAEVFQGKQLEMIFVVSNQQVQIQSRSRGTFIYDIVAQRFVLGSAAPDRGR